ncbi:MAG TPA: hypothetical protein VGI39_01375 [Polyangiaceae bacterium]|jgi:hypothetical protein
MNKLSLRARVLVSIVLAAVGGCAGAYCGATEHEAAQERARASRCESKLETSRQIIQFDEDLLDICQAALGPGSDSGKISAPVAEPAADKAHGTEL